MLIPQNIYGDLLSLWDEQNVWHYLFPQTVKNWLNKTQFISAHDSYIMNI